METLQKEIDESEERLKEVILQHENIEFIDSLFDEPCKLAQYYCFMNSTYINALNNNYPDELKRILTLFYQQHPEKLNDFQLNDLFVHSDEAIYCIILNLKKKIIIPTDYILK